MNAIRRALLYGMPCVALVSSLSPAAAQSTKVGVFNAQAVSENTELGKRIQAELTTFTESKEAEIAQRQQRLAELRKQASQQALSLSAEKRSAMEKDMQRQGLELQSLQESASRELELEYASATKAFQEKLIRTIEDFGKDEGFAVILDRSQVAWADAATDVTSAIIDRFNRKFPVTAEPSK